MDDQASERAAGASSSHVASTDRADAPLRCITADIDEFRTSLNTVYYPAAVDLVGDRRGPLHAELSAFRLNHLTIGRVRFGSDAIVDPGDLGTYHVNVPLTGKVVSECGEQQTLATPGHAAVFTPNEHTILPQWDGDATQVCIKIDRASLEGELTRILGRPIDRRIRFDLAMDLTSPAGQRWLSTLKVLLDTVDDPHVRSVPGLAAQTEYLERALISGLLVQQPHSMIQQVHTPPTVRGPRAVAQVLDHIAAFPGSQFTIGDLAAIAGVGALQLQNLFQEQFDMSPTTYIRHLRLDGVRNDLLHGDDSTRIGDVAFRWGFNHLGRFASLYEQKFGETPSQTLRGAAKSSTRQRM